MHLCAVYAVASGKSHVFVLDLLLYTAAAAAVEYQCSCIMLCLLLGTLLAVG